MADMPCLKQRTVNGTRYELWREQSPVPEKQFEYWVGRNGKDPEIAGRVFTKTEAERLFRRTVERNERSLDAPIGVPGIPGFGPTRSRSDHNPRHRY